MSLESIKTGGDGMFTVGVNGVREILTPKDKKIDIIKYDASDTF